MSGPGTDRLIEVLAADPRPGPPVAAGAALALLGAAPVTLLAVAVVLGLRPDLLAEAGLVLAKAALPLGAAVAGLGGALALSRPEGRARGPGLALAALALAGALAVTLALAGLPEAARGAALRGRTLGFCLVAVPTLAALPTALLLGALRRGAPTRPGLAGAMAGLCGGGLAAALYALHCPEDAVPFFVTWYGAGIGLAGLGGALAGRRVLRW